jgi:methylsterol monooxygenase
MLIHGILFVGMGIFFFVCDRFSYLEQYKLHRTKAMVPTQILITRTLKEAAVNQLVIGPLVLYFVYDGFKYFGSPSLRDPSPEFYLVFLMFLAANLVNGWGFYFAHRLLHHKLIYAHVHKQHHTYKGPISVAAEYAHPLEQALANQLPTVGACLLGGFPFLVWFVWLAARLEETYEGHSGYSFHGSLAHKYLGLTHGTHTVYHDFHHTGNRGNYGGPEYLDYFFGTMQPWIDIGGTEGYLALGGKHTEQSKLGVHSDKHKYKPPE